jgi:acetaldehyde dehydrogenase (acetylating)
VLEDKDLLSVQKARHLVELADKAEHVLKTFSQERIDRIVAAMAAAAEQNSHRLAALAIEETGRGKLADKVTKNLFASVRIYEHLKDLKTCGVISEDKESRVIEIGVPFGVIAAIVPTTNPTSTTIFKVLASVKGRNSVVVGPHPQAVGCTAETVRVMYEAALEAGAPENCVNCLDVVTLEGTQELMRHKKTALILATGGPGLVRAAYSSGKPAYGVGAGNVPAFIEKTADVEKAVRDVLAGKTFDNGLLCSSEQAIVCDKTIESQVLEELKSNNAYLVSAEEQVKLEALVQRPDGRLNADIAGQSPQTIAKLAGFAIPREVVCLVGRPLAVGLDHPLSMEKLSPILALFVVDGWEAGCEKCIEILEFGGIGHTMAIHSQDQKVILEFGLRKPAYRICVNTPATQGSVGLTTGLPPSMTLGCGGSGGNITSDNITALHLINIRRLAFEITPSDKIQLDGGNSSAGTKPPQMGNIQDVPVQPMAQNRDQLPESDQLRRIVTGVVQDYLVQEGSSVSSVAHSVKLSDPEAEPSGSEAGAAFEVVDFVCEDDVRQALSEGKKIAVDSNTIITPSALDCASGNDVLLWD